jgi:hypothetical protein
MLARETLLHVQRFPVNLNRRFPFQVTYHHRHAKLRRYAQQHVDMIRHHMSFDQPDLLLSAQLLKQLAYPLTHMPKHRLAPVFGHDHYVILTFPFYMG